MRIWEVAGQWKVGGCHLRFVSKAKAEEYAGIKEGHSNRSDSTGGELPEDTDRELSGSPGDTADSIADSGDQRAEQSEV